jgi:crotonobetainyl-CoA hydratase
MAVDIIAAAPLSVAAILDIGRRTAHMDSIAAIKAIRELPSYRAAIDSEDAAEGTAAFSEKRAPVWKGR